MRELENQLAAEKRVVKGSTAMCQFTKPPLGRPQKQRPPLGRITNRVPPMGVSRPTATTSVRLSQNKENDSSLAASNSYGLNPQNRGINKARRVSVAAPLAAKRRTSLAFPPSMRDPQTMIAERKYSQLEQQFSQLQGQRRSSLAVVPATPLIGAYSASNSKYRSILMSSSKYAPSPPNAVSAWRSRLPSVAALSRPQVRLVRSPANGNKSTPEGEASSRYCFSVQKRVQVDSLRHQPLTLRVPQVLTGAGISGLPLRDNVNGATRFAAPQAKRVLCNNSKRRMSVL